jgi:hypothetical protein
LVCSSIANWTKMTTIISCGLRTPSFTDNTYAWSLSC